MTVGWAQGTPTPMSLWVLKYPMRCFGDKEWVKKAVGAGGEEPRM